MMILDLLLFCLLLPIADLKKECHKNCTCKWKNGKQTVECSGGSLVGLPSGINSGTQVLDLTGNILRTLPSKGFQLAGLVNLQKVYLSRCGLVQIADDAFYHLSNLVELDLTHNFLTWVPSAALKDCPLLRRLQLSHNPIQKLDNNSFVYLHRLTSLELSHCQVEAVERQAFVGLQNLEFLKLDGNRMQRLAKDAVEFLPRLYALDLHNNPWNCDCRVRGMRFWMLERNVPYSVPPRCEQPPRLRDVGWNVLELDDFACPPEITTADTKVVASEGTNATLECRIRAIPEAAVTWFWRGRVVANRSPMSFGRQINVIHETGQVHKASSLTIVNALMKDSGHYICVASNRAGNVSVNVTLSVTARNMSADSLSGGEIVGIVIGLLLVMAIMFVGVCVFVLHRRSFPSIGKPNLPLTFHRKYDKPKENHFEMTTVDVNSTRDNANLVHKGRNSGYGSDGSGSSVSAKGNHDPGSADKFIREVNPAKGASASLAAAGANNAEYGATGYAESDCDDPQFCRDSANIYSAKGLPDTVIKNPRRTHCDMSQTLGRHRTKNEGPVFRYDNNSSYGATLYGTWKRNHSAANPLHVALSPEARDSPDEGLGDEREYETDILE